MRLTYKEWQDSTRALGGWTCFEDGFDKRFREKEKEGKAEGGQEGGRSGDEEADIILLQAKRGPHHMPGCRSEGSSGCLLHSKVLDS